MDQRRIDAHTTEWVTARGALRISRPVLGLVRTQVVGFAPGTFLEPIIAAVDAEIAARRRPDVFHDWDEMTGYESASRTVMTSWYARVRDDCESVQVYTKSKIVAMGVSLVAFATGNRIIAHTAREAFEQAYASVQQARRGKRAL